MELISTKICKTSDIGVNDNLFGGVMLQWIDEAGGIMACYLCCTPNMITLKMDEVVFKSPVKVKDHIRIYGKVNNVGRSSLVISVEARRFVFGKRIEELVCSTRITFVKINEKGKAASIEEKQLLQIKSMIAL